MIKLILIVIFLAFKVEVAEALNRWVSTGGQDSNDCAAVTSVNQPANLGTGSKRTIADANGCMASGDTMMIVAGSYYEGIWTSRWTDGSCQRGLTGQQYNCVISGPEGGGYTTFSAAPGSEGKVIIGNNSGFGAQNFEGPMRHIKFYGLVFEGYRSGYTCWDDALWTWTGNGSFTCPNMTPEFSPTPPSGGFVPSTSTHRGAGVGCASDGQYAGWCDPSGGYPYPAQGEDIVYDSVTIRNFWHQGFLGGGINIVLRNMNVYNNGEDISKDHGIYVGGGNVIVESSVIHNNANFATQFYHEAVGVNNGIFRSNFVYDNKAGLTMQGNIGNQAYNNVFYYSRTFSYYSHDDGGFVPYLGTGLFIAYNSGPSHFNNNTFYNVSVCVAELSNANNTFKNNLCVASGSLYVNYGGNVGTSFDGTNINVPATVMVNPPAGDFRLVSSASTAINTGTNLSTLPSPFNFSTDANGIARPQGAAWDIGACEYFAAGTKCPNFTPIVPVGPTITITSPTSNSTYTSMTSTINLGGTTTKP